MKFDPREPIACYAARGGTARRCATSQAPTLQMTENRVGNRFEFAFARRDEIMIYYAAIRRKDSRS